MQANVAGSKTQSQKEIQVAVVAPSKPRSATPQPMQQRQNTRLETPKPPYQQVRQAHGPAGQAPGCVYSPQAGTRAISPASSPVNMQVIAKGPQGASVWTQARARAASP